MNNPVSFELAKLLKEKKFNEICRHFYYSLHSESSAIEATVKVSNTELATRCYSAPTIVEVVMWLYEKHDIWIKVDCDSKESWSPIIVNVEDGNYKVHPYYVSQKFIATNNRWCVSPTEAYEAAIEYCLTNII